MVRRTSPVTNAALAPVTAAPECEITRKARGISLRLEDRLASVAPSHSGINSPPNSVYETLMPQVVRISRNVLGKTPPQELTHDICVDVMLSLPNFRGDCALYSWIFAVVSRRVHAWIRKEGRYRRFLGEEYRGVRPPWTAGPEDELSSLEHVCRIREALLALPERERLCLTLVRFESVSVQEVASRLQISPDAVRMSIFRARAHIRKALKEDAAE